MPLPTDHMQTSAVLTSGAGSGASTEGNRPFLDLLDVDTGETERLWQSSPPFLESTGSLLCDLHDQPIRQVLYMYSIVTVCLL